MRIYNNNTLFHPVRTVVGQEKTKELPTILASIGCQNPLYIVSHAAEASGISELFESNSPTDYYPLVAKEVDTNTIASLVIHFRKYNHDCVVGVGGGTVLDVAKITRLQLSLSSCDLEQLEGTSSRLPEKSIPLILIPTIIGSSSGATKTAYLRKAHSEGFMYFSQRLLYPDVTILDTKVSRTVGGTQTVLSVATIVTRAVESLTSNLASPLTDAYARQSIRLVVQHALRVVNSPHDAEARLHLAIASQLTGMATSHTGAALAHAISVAVAQTTPISYAQCMFIVLPHALHFNLTGNESALIEIKACITGEHSLSNEKDEAEALAAITTICDFLYSLTSSLPQAIPLRLYDASKALHPNQLGQIAYIVYGSLDTLTSKQRPTLQDIGRVLEAAYWGYPLDRNHGLQKK